MNTAEKPQKRAWTAPHREQPLDAVVSIPGSKSQTARALVLAALADGPSTLVRPLNSRDTVLMAQALESLGVEVDTSDPERWTVVPGELRSDAAVDCGLAGTVMRFLPPVAALAPGRVSFDGDEAAYKRPVKPVLEALKALGVAIEDEGRGALPFSVEGTGSVKGGAVSIDASASSQFVTALLLAAPRFEQGLELTHVGGEIPSRPYLDMAVGMLREAGVTVDDSVPDRWKVEPGPVAAREWVVEPDLQNAAPFALAPLVVGGRVTVTGWPRETTQAGDHLREVIGELGGRTEWSRGGLTVVAQPMNANSRFDLSDASEITPTLAALAAVTKGHMEIRGVEHIRGHETDRIDAMVTELRKIGATVEEHADGLTVIPGLLSASVFETYDDHRIAHAAVLAGLAVRGIELSDVACTSKTWPEFPEVWEEFANGEGV
ncbi:3-phosphoshikimate 1-carboxyvinyltransferase [Salininema proteolyticum]|uniref:3-phosphoshikimate 1-carboxyvinyltransferase n=1 Tax=Salininema proteolyticum TaxID=1607685 RepID=A0ABV8U0R4_9ACTN